MRRKPKHFIPNILTLVNMFLGFMAIGMILKGHPLKAGVCVLIAGLFDVFDGKLARLLGIPSRLGAEFDSFADTISFCTVPSLIIYSVYVEGLPPILGGMFSFIPLELNSLMAFPVNFPWVFTTGIFT